MLFCGCGRKTEVETETMSFVETSIEELYDTAYEIFDYSMNLYSDAAKEIFGDSYDDTKATYDINGITYDGRFVSWEYLDEVAYNSMING